MCEWFAKCDKPADGVVKHPILGDVLTCTRCADKLGLELVVVCPECKASVVATDNWQSDTDPGFRTVTGSCNHTWEV